jgi:polygalacturonase
VATNVQAKLRESVSVLDFGAVGNGLADDTASIQNAINYAQTLVTDRFLSGCAVVFPAGTYLISGTLTVTTSNVSLVGDSPSASVLYAPNATFDLIHFNGSSLALYQVGAQNLRFYTPGNTTAGCHIRARGVINGIFDNLSLVGWYDGIVIDGCGRTYFSNLLLTQENRTPGTLQRYALDFFATSGQSSDVHVSNYQVTVQDVLTAGAVISIRGADGIYFSNGHQNGSTLLQPDGVTCASIMGSNVYFDKGSDNNFVFAGTSSAYRNFFFNNCYFRDARGSGIIFQSISAIEKIIFSGCQITAATAYGLTCISTSVASLVIDGCLFDGNNTSNIAAGGDIRVVGKASITACRFIGGGAAGTSISLPATATFCIVDGCTFEASTAGTKILNAGSQNIFGLLYGFVIKNNGSATLASGTTSIVVDHGLAVTPANTQISVTPRSSLSGGGSWWISNVTATQFTINVQTAPSASIFFSWQVDASK